MSIKRYILYEFKINLPLFIVFSAFAFLYASLSAAAFDFTITNAHYVFYTNDILTSFAIVPLIFALIYPLTIFSYRYSRNSTDFYYQLAIDKRFYKRVKCIFGLAILVIVFTVAYLFGSLILALRFLTTKLENNEVFIDFYFLGLLTSYPFFLLSIICAYFVSFFLSSLGYGNKDKILLFIFGMVFLLFNPSCLFYLVYLLFDLSKSGIASTFANPFIISLSPISNFVTSSRISTALCTYNTFLSLSNASNMCAFICYFIQLALSVLLFIYAFNKKEKSGEYSLKSGSYDTITYLIPHLAFLVAGIYVSTSFNVLGFVSFYVLPVFIITIYYASYYFGLVWYYKRLKLPKKDFIALASNSALILLLSIAFSLLSSSRY